MSTTTRRVIIYDSLEPSSDYDGTRHSRCSSPLRHAPKSIWSGLCTMGAARHGRRWLHTSDVRDPDSKHTVRNPRYNYRVLTQSMLAAAPGSGVARILSRLVALAPCSRLHLYMCGPLAALGFSKHWKPHCRSRAACKLPGARGLTRLDVGRTCVPPRKW